MTIYRLGSEWESLTSLTLHANTCQSSYKLHCRANIRKLHVHKFSLGMIIYETLLLTVYSNYNIWDGYTSQVAA